MNQPIDRRRPRQLIAASVVAACIAVTGCGSSDDDDAAAADPSPASTSAGAEVADGSPAAGTESAAAALEERRTVIDVRTPAEFAAGHVEEAELIDAQGDDFDSLVADLDDGGAYVVYCRTGNRSAAAAGRMRAVGLDVLDGGAMDDMLAAGWPPAG